MKVSEFEGLTCVSHACGTDNHFTCGGCGIDLRVLIGDFGSDQLDNLAQNKRRTFGLGNGA
jgi:hypothetical protein